MTEAQVIRGRLLASPVGGNIVVRWTSQYESGVEHYIVLRRSASTNDFVQVGRVEPLGDGREYEFVDRTVFKNSDAVFQYRVRVINGQNPAPETEIVSVSYSTSSTARRTWGSIKAMFR